MLGHTAQSVAAQRCVNTIDGGRFKYRQVLIIYLSCLCRVIFSSYFDVCYTCTYIFAFSFKSVGVNAKIVEGLKFVSMVEQGSKSTQ